LLRWRLILGATLIAAVALLCWLDYHAARPGIYLLPLALIAAGLGAGELVSMWRDQPHAPRAEVIYGGTLLVVAASALPLVWPKASAASGGPLGLSVLAFAVVVMWSFVAEMRHYEQPGGVANRVALATFAVAYVGLLLGFAVQLRMLGGGKAGLMALVSLILVVKMTDIGAYAVGRLVGRHKMTPTLSPGKTWEGFAGGMAFAIASSFALFQVALPRLELTPDGERSPGWGWLAFGVAIAVAGTIGDLAESLLKRDAGRKDSSTWMPGFGGVLDLLDSILTAAPVAYAFWAVGLVGR
jgi:phosphatidate cytidylyltransferase